MTFCICFTQILNSFFFLLQIGPLPFEILLDSGDTSYKSCTAIAVCEIQFDCFFSLNSVNYVNKEIFLMMPNSYGF